MNNSRPSARPSESHPDPARPDDPIIPNPGDPYPGHPDPAYPSADHPAGKQQPAEGEHKQQPAEGGQSSHQADRDHRPAGDRQAPARGGLGDPSPGDENPRPTEPSSR